MGLLGSIFGKNTSESKKPAITAEDVKWVDNGFGWLLATWGYLQKDEGTFLFTEQYFPVTFQTKKINIDTLLTDLCNLLSIYRATVSFTLVPDIRDIPQTPYSIQGKAFESDIEVITEKFTKPHYNIYIANSLVYEEELLIRRLILELIKVKVNEKLPDFISKGDVSYFTYIASIYFGFGVIISKGLIDVGIQYIAGWQRTSSSKAEVPYPVIAYALAFYSKVKGNESPEWKKELPKDIQDEFDLAMEHLITNSDKVFFTREKFETDVKAKKHIALGRGFFKNGQFEEALKEYDIAIPLVTNTNQLSVLCNNAGYCCQRMQQFDKSLSYLLKSLEVRPDFAYAMNNLGFTYILMDQLEKGKVYLDKVAVTDDILKAYLLRDFAVYYMKKGDNTLADDFFKQAFDISTPIDLLEYFYAKYLFAKSENDEAMKYLTMSVEKGEKEGIELMNMMK